MRNPINETRSFMVQNQEPKIAGKLGKRDARMGIRNPFNPEPGEIFNYEAVLEYVTAYREEKERIEVNMIFEYIHKVTKRQSSITGLISRLLGY